MLTNATGIRKAFSMPRDTTSAASVPMLRLAARPKMATLVAEAIIQDIVAQNWPEGALLGTEAQLTVRYGVSRATLREAIRGLERQGAVASRPRVGLVVAAPARESVIVGLASFIAFSGATMTELLATRSLLTARLFISATERGHGAALANHLVPPSSRLAQKGWHSELARALHDAANEPVIKLLIDALAPFQSDKMIAEDSRTTARNAPKLISALKARNAGAIADSVHQSLCLRAGADDRTAVRRAEQNFGSVKRGAAIARIIADAIDKAAPGVHLGTEADLLSRYPVSRAIMREALGLLEDHGLVVRRRGLGGGLIRGEADPRGTVDAAATYLHFLRLAPNNVSAARYALELEAAALAAIHATPEQKKLLCASLKRCQSADPGDLEQGRIFHTLLARAGGNRVMSLFIELLMHTFYRMPPAHVTQIFLNTLHATHAEVFDAVVRRDPTRARRAMTAHLQFADDCLRTGAIAV